MITRKPRIGDIVRWPKQTNIAHRVLRTDDDGICWIETIDGPRSQHGNCFIWKFHDGSMNQLAVIANDKEPL